MAQDDPYAATAEAPADPYASTADTDTLSEGGTKQKRPGVFEGIERGKNDVINVFKPLSADERQQFESTFGKVPGAALEGVSNATLGVASAGASLLLHPLGSIYGSAQMAADALNQIFPDSGLNQRQKAAKDASLERLKTQWESIKENPDWAMGNIVGGIYAGKAIGDTVGPVTKGLIEKAGKLREGIRTSAQSLVGAGARPVAAAVAEAGEAAKTADEAHLEKTQEALHETKGRELKAEQDRKAELQKHFEETQKAKGETGTSPESGRTLTPEEQVSRRQAIEHGIDRADPEVRKDLETTYETAKENANKPYNELRGELDHVEADPEKVELIVADGADSIRGSETQPTVLKNMSERLDAMKRGVRTDNFTYDDLQGYREEIGRELRKGTLPPDVFDAYKKMLEGITNEMEGIARRTDEKNALDSGTTLPKDQTLEGKLKAARAGYRQYAETFLDKTSPIRKALNSAERGEIVQAFLGADQTGIEALAKYNPKLARQLNSLRTLQEEANSLPKEKPEKFSKAPTLAPKTPAERTPIPDRPEQIEVNTQAIRAKLLDRWTHGESSLNKWQVRALLSGGIGSVVGMIVGHGEGLEAAGAVSAGTYAFGPAVVAKILEKPAVVEWLTRPPKGELDTLMSLPNADRIKIVDGLRNLIRLAPRGIKVDPTLAALVGATAAVTGPKSQKIQQTRDEWYATHPR